MGVVEQYFFVGQDIFGINIEVFVIVLFFEYYVCQEFDYIVYCNWLIVGIYLVWGNYDWQFFYQVMDDFKGSVVGVDDDIGVQCGEGYFVIIQDLFYLQFGFQVV